MPSWKAASQKDSKALRAVELLLATCPARVEQIFLPREPGLRISPEGLIRSLPPRERILVGLAYDFWSPMIGIKVTDLESLSNEEFENVIKALIFLRTP